MNLICAKTRVSGHCYGVNLKIRHGANVDNVDTYVYAKFGYDRLRYEKALADRKSDNNNTNNVVGHWRPVPGSKK